MPRNILALTVLTVLSTSLTSALPHWPHERSTATPTLTVPLLSGLPTPPAGLTLKYVALCLGTQNYSCPSTTTTGASSASSSSPTSTSPQTPTPIPIGALATLYDATHLLLSTSVLDPAALPALTHSLPCLADALNMSLGLPFLGHHYFDGLSRPTFDLTAASPPAFLSAKKVADVPAPVGTGLQQSCKGRDGAAAVDWLMLEDCGDGLSRGGVSVAYRVETAGGKAVGVCAAGQMGEVVVSDYAAEYWFYG